MKTEADSTPPGYAIFGGGTQSISEIILNLRTTFRTSDFNRAEEELVDREESLRRDISRLKKEKHLEFEKHELARMEIVDLREELAAAKRSSGGGANLEREIAAAEERFAKALEHMAAEEKEKESLSSEVSELRKKLEESEKRIASLENDVFVLGRRNSGAKSSLVEPIVIIDIDDDFPVKAKSPKKESPPWNPKVPKREQCYSLSPRESGNKDYPNPRDRTVSDKDADQEPKAPPPIIEPLDSPAKRDSLGKRQFSFSNDSNTVPKKRSPMTRDYKLFWSGLSDRD